jgi:L-ascorbate oxidase
MARQATGIAGRRSLALGAATLALTVFSAGAASAQIGVDIADPPILQRRPPARPSTALLQGAVPADEQRLDLNIQYVPGTIYNPSTGKQDSVNLRSYTQPGTRPKALYISPAIHTRPGQTLRVKLNNHLPADPSCTGGNHDEPNQPHCFNGTNLHTHGLWVNPSGNGDNVLLSVNPETSFEYEYAIPPEHPAGTFWYHTHRHGSTALQVSSGMAGALIIKGDRLPTATAQGDLDTLLAGVKDLRDRTLVFQQIQYGCLDRYGNIKVRKATVDGKEKVVEWICGVDDVGGIETYSDKNHNGFGPGSWGGSARYTSINGLILPDFKSKSGIVERWRLIHAGVRDTIGLQFRKAKANTKLRAGPALAAERMPELIANNCTGEPLDFHLAAADGITMASALPTNIATLQPGYRFDALVVFPDAGDYCVIDADTGATIDGAKVGSRLLGMARVAAGTPVAGPVGAYLTDQLVKAAQGLALQPAIRDAVVKDLQTDIGFRRFTPHADIADSEVTGTQELTFLINVNSTPLRFEVGSQDYEPRPYDAGRVDRVLTLGGVDEWTLRSDFVSHPFHIHVNPFQIVKIVDPNGKEVSGRGTNDDYGGTTDPQYRGLMNVWKDTLWVKSLIGEGEPIPAGTSGIYTITVRTRYERYIGEFVLHCHILDHEDRGMMQNVAIVLPGGTPASVNAADHDGH